MADHTAGEGDTVLKRHMASDDYLCIAADIKLGRDVGLTKFIDMSTQCGRASTRSCRARIVASSI
jgi:hypothetical protein